MGQEVHLGMCFDGSENNILGFRFFLFLSMVSFLMRGLLEIPLLHIVEGLKQLLQVILMQGKQQAISLSYSLTIPNILKYYIGLTKLLPLLVRSKRESILGIYLDFADLNEIDFFRKIPFQVYDIIFIDFDSFQQLNHCPFEVIVVTCPQEVNGVKKPTEPMLKHILS
jgi:hypothetical protein